jgi:uncharacterized phage protein (TIGR02220 family)
MGSLRHVGLRIMKLALRVAGLTFLQRLVLVAIASHADDHGRAWPGEQLLAAETSLALRSVRNAVRGLEGLGLVTVTRRGRRLPNEYAVQVDRLERLPRVTGTTGHLTGTTCRSPEAERPASDDTVTGTSRQGDRHVVPPKGSRRAQEGRTNKNGGADAPASAAHWLLLLNHATGSAFRPVDANLRPIRARVREGYTTADAEIVVEAKVAEWTGTEFAKYLRPSTVFGPKFDPYLQAARNGNGGQARRRVNDAWRDVADGEVEP